MATEYNFRSLNSEDIFPMCAIIGKIGVDQFVDILSADGMKERVLKIVGEETGENAYQLASVGVMTHAAVIVCRNITACKTEIYGLLSSVSGVSIPDLKAMSPAEFMRMIKAFFKMDGFNDFFTEALEFADLVN